MSRTRDKNDDARAPARALFVLAAPGACCDGRAHELMLLTRSAIIRAEIRPWWSIRGDDGAALAAVAPAWLSSRRRATLGGSCLDDEHVPRWGATGRRWSGVTGRRHRRGLLDVSSTLSYVRNPQLPPILLPRWLGGASRRLSLPALRACHCRGSLTSGSTWWCRPRSDHGHDAGLQPALLGLSIRPLNARHHPVACQATTRLAACPYRSDSLHFVVVCPVLLQVASIASLVFPSGREAPVSLHTSCVKCDSRAVNDSNTCVCLLVVHHHACHRLYVTTIG